MSLRPRAPLTATNRASSPPPRAHPNTAFSTTLVGHGAVAAVHAVSKGATLLAASAASRQRGFGSWPNNEDALSELSIFSFEGEGEGRFSMEDERARHIALCQQSKEDALVTVYVLVPSPHV